MGYYNILKNCTLPDYKNGKVIGIAPVKEQKIAEKTLQSLEMEDFYPYLIEVSNITINLLVNNEDGTDFTEIGYAMLRGSGAFKNTDEREDFIELLKNDLIKEAGLDEKETKNKVKTFVKDLERLIIELKSMKLDNFNFQEVLHENPSDEKALIKLASNMKLEFNIKGIVNSEGKREYYYQNGNTFCPLDDIKYQELTKNKYDLSISSHASRRSLESIICNDEINRDFWELEDCYFKPSTNEIFYKKDLEELILTNRQFKLGDRLVSYNKNVEVINENPTLWEKTLKEILIPKNNQEDTELYYDFLAITGMCLEQNDKWKILPIFYNPDGDNGKTLAKDMQNLTFGVSYYELSIRNFRDNFLNSLIDDTNIITVDEVKTDSFKGCEDFLKRISAGGLNNLGVRKMRSDKKYKSNGFGTFITYTNEIPELEQQEALLKRLYLGRLPNKFVDGEPTAENEYPKDEDLMDEVSKDFDGFSWFCNVLIKAKMEFKKPVQDEDFKIKVLSRNSMLGLFLLENYKPSNDNKVFINNKDIINELNQNIKLKNDLMNGGGSLSRKIGWEVKKIFGDDIKGTDSSNTVIYYLEKIEE